MKFKYLKNGHSCTEYMHALISNICDTVLGALHAILFCLSFVYCRSKKSVGESERHTMRIGSYKSYGKSGRTVLNVHGLVDNFS